MEIACNIPLGGFMGKIFSLLILVLSSHLSYGLQGLLDCTGPKISMEIWFSGQSETPTEASVYKIAPELGLPSYMEISDFNWFSVGLSFDLLPNHPENPLLRFNLQSDHINGGYSGVLEVKQGNSTTIYPGHRCILQ